MFHMKVFISISVDLVSIETSYIDWNSHIWVDNIFRPSCIDGHPCNNHLPLYIALQKVQRDYRQYHMLDLAMDNNLKQTNS